MSQLFDLKLEMMCVFTQNNPWSFNKHLLLFLLSKEKESEKMEYIKRMWPTESAKQISYNLTVNEMASTGPAWVSTRSSAYIIYFSLFNFYRIFQSVSLIFEPALFLLLGCLVQHQCNGFFLLSYVLFWHDCLLSARSMFFSNKR